MAKLKTYVGRRIGDGTYAVIRADFKPTEETHGAGYSRIDGPFKTVREARDTAAICNRLRRNAKASERYLRKSQVIHMSDKATINDNSGLFKTLCGRETGRLDGVLVGPRVAAYAGEVTCGTCRKAMAAALREES